MPADKPDITALLPDRHLLSLLVCPQTSMTLTYDAAQHELVSPTLGCAFAITKGVPVMVLKEARLLNETQKAALKKRHRTDDQ